MKYNQFARTDLKVSEICLGTMTWGNQNTESDAHEQMDYAVEQGINFFDTAELYAVPPAKDTQGLTETYIGNWFKQRGKRDDIILATKATGKMMGAGIPWIRNSEGLNGPNLKDALEGSLQRLQMDYVDLYQLHAPNRAYPHHGKHWGGTIDFTTDTTTQKEVDEFCKILETLSGFVKEGKVRHIGLSNDTAWGVMTYLHLSETKDFVRLSSIQNEYSLLYRVDEVYLGEVCVREDVAYLPYSPLAAGALSGKYLDGARPKGSRWSLDNRPNQRDTDNAMAAIREYMSIAEKHGLDVCQMALQFVNKRPFVTSNIIGATSMEQLKRDIGSKDVTLTDDILADIDAVYKKYPMPY